jgi:hypothetical protein
MKLTTLLFGVAVLAGSLACAPGANALPNGLPHAQQLAKGENNLEQVRWVCSPWGRCWWRPNFYGAYAYYPPPPRVYFGRPWWHRPWRHRWW